jgi:hypothetical protein
MNPNYAIKILESYKINDFNFNFLYIENKIESDGFLSVYINFFLYIDESFLKNNGFYELIKYSCENKHYIYNENVEMELEYYPFETIIVLNDHCNRILKNNPNFREQYPKLSSYYTNFLRRLRPTRLTRITENKLTIGSGIKENPTHSTNSFVNSYERYREEVIIEMANACLTIDPFVKSKITLSKF